MVKLWPIVGLRKAWNECFEVLLLPLPFIILVGVHPSLIVAPLLLYWAIGNIWDQE